MSLKLIPTRQQKICSSALSSDYIQSEIKGDPRKLIMLLQFIHYAKDLDFEIETLDDINYRGVTFQLQDFLRLQNQSSNQSQLIKPKAFFKELQTGILITSFTDKYFQSLVAVPIVKFEKVDKFLVAKVWLVEKLFFYKYPFLVPDLFRTKLKKDEFNIRFAVFQAFHSANIEKVINVKEFINSYPSSLNNGKKTNIKKSFLESVQMLEDKDLIQPSYKIISDGHFYPVDKLTIENISEGFIVYEKLSS